MPNYPSLPKDFKMHFFFKCPLWFSRYRHLSVKGKYCIATGVEKISNSNFLDYYVLEYLYPIQLHTTECFIIFAYWIQLWHWVWLVNIAEVSTPYFSLNFEALCEHNNHKIGCILRPLSRRPLFFQLTARPLNLWSGLETSNFIRKWCQIVQLHYHH